MFVDEVEIEVRGGRGGNGAVSFRREKHVPRGGPDGGQGGRGGSIVLVADPSISTLIDFHYAREYRAQRGTHGGGTRKSGKSAADIELRVPVGTVAYDSETGELISDLVHAGQREVVAHGGSGGRGNQSFVSSTHQSPRFAENGEPGTERRIRLELKLLADVGLVGLPNAGKSSLISKMSAAKPKIADYPFTTLVPNLGVVQVGPGQSYVVADIPGLIEGASEGVGLGHQFLRHVERTRLLAHLIDVSGLTMTDPLEDWDIVNRELMKHRDSLGALPQVAVLNKMDMPEAQDVAAAVEAQLEERGYSVFRISALTGEGVQPLIYHIHERLSELTEAPASAEEDRMIYRGPKDEPLEIEKRDGVFVVKGQGFERLVAMTDMNNEAGVRRLQRIMEKAGVVSRLRDLGAEEGDQVQIGASLFDWVD